MDETDLINALKKARKLIEDAGFDPDSPSGVAALQEMLNRLAPPVPSEPQQTAVPREEESSTGTLSDSPAARVATWLGVDIIPVQDIIEFDSEGSELQLPMRTLPSGKLARQRVLGLIKLATDRVGYGKQEVSFREVNTLCDRYACLDQNLPSNLRNFENYVSMRGQRGSHTYRITQPGLEAAREQLLRIIGGT